MHFISQMASSRYGLASMSAISAPVRQSWWTLLTCVCLQLFVLNVLSQRMHFTLWGQCLCSMWRLMSAGLFMTTSWGSRGSRSQTLQRKPPPGRAVVIASKSYLVEAVSEIWQEKTLSQYVNWVTILGGGKHGQCGIHISNLCTCQRNFVDLSNMYLPRALRLEHRVTPRTLQSLRTVLELNVTLHVSRPFHNLLANITTESSFGKGGRHTVKIILGGGGIWNLTGKKTLYQ